MSFPLLEVTFITALIHFAGAVLSGYLVFEASRDLWYIKTRQLNGERGPIAWSNLRSESIRLSVQILLLANRVPSFFVPLESYRNLINDLWMLVAFSMTSNAFIAALLMWQAIDQFRTRQIIYRHRYDDPEEQV